MSTSKNIEKNPYDRGNGVPIFGKEPEFFAWARKKELERRKTLPPEEQKKLAEADKHLDDKMDS
jgi:hypothetical protein